MHGNYLPLKPATEVPSFKSQSSKKQFSQSRWMLYTDSLTIYPATDRSKYLHYKSLEHITENFLLPV